MSYVKYRAYIYIYTYVLTHVIYRPAGVWMRMPDQGRPKNGAMVVLKGLNGA